MAIIILTLIFYYSAFSVSPLPHHYDEAVGVLRPENPKLEERGEVEVLKRSTGW